jgi:hypothetical protein
MSMLRLPDHAAIFWLAFLQSECVKRSPATTTSGAPQIRLTQFLKILIEHQNVLPVKVLGYKLAGKQPLAMILQRRSGIAMINDGNGHVVGLACKEKVLVDSDPEYGEPLDLCRAGATDALAKRLGVLVSARLDVMYLCLQLK